MTTPDLQRSRLRFMHIPKAGGTTLNAILARQYHPRYTFAFTGNVESDIARYESLSPAERRSIVLFIGHAALDSGLRDADEARTFTMLREPVSRVKSFCQHVAEGKSPYLLADFPPESFDLDRFLDSGDGHLSNQQTRILINQGDIGSAARIDRLSSSDALEIALKNLFDRISLFGLQESFDESVRLFADELGWSSPWYFSKNRRDTGRRLRFERRHIDRIAELNAIDMELYSAARRRFSEIIEARGSGGSAAFTAANSIIAPGMAVWDDLRLRSLYWYKRLTGQLDGS